MDFSARCLAGTASVQPDESLPPAHLIEDEPKQPVLPHHPRAGTTHLKLLLSEEGRVVTAVVLQSHGDPRMDEVVMRAVGGWRFEAPRIDGKPACAWQRYSFTVQLVD